MVDDYKYKTNDLGFAEKRALQNSYNKNIGIYLFQTNKPILEDELADAYKATNALEKDMKRLVLISEIMLDKYQEFESQINFAEQEKEEKDADLGYLQEMYDQVSKSS